MGIQEPLAPPASAPHEVMWQALTVRLGRSLTRLASLIMTPDAQATAYTLHAPAQAMCSAIIDQTANAAAQTVSARVLQTLTTKAKRDQDTQARRAQAKKVEGPASPDTSGDEEGGSTATREPADSDGDGLHADRDPDVLEARLASRRGVKEERLWTGAL